MSSPSLRSAVARIYLQGGCLSQASLHFSIVAADPNVDASMKAMNRALFSVASGDLALASESLRFLLEEDSENYVVGSISHSILSYKCLWIFRLSTTYRSSF
jgi:hypothetical protein